MKALVGAFNQEKALVGAFSVIVQPVVEPMEYYTALFLNSALISRLSWSSSAVIFSTGKLGASSWVRISAGVIVLVSLAPDTSGTNVRAVNVNGQWTFEKWHSARRLEK